MSIRYWATRLGEGGKYIDFGKKGKYIAIGWELGNLGWVANYRGDEDRLWEKLWDLVKNTYGGTSVSIGIATGQVLSFVKGMSLRDIVLVPDFNKGQFLVAEVSRVYEYKKHWGDGCPYQNRRKVRWKSPISMQGVSRKLKNSFYSWLTVFSIDHHAQELVQILSGIKPSVSKRGVVDTDVYSAVIDRLMGLNPQEFEGFMAHILSTIGFQAAATQYVGDKGVDVSGTLSAEGVAEITLKLQVKRIKPSIGIDEVLKIRGTLAGDEHGAIVTT